MYIKLGKFSHVAPWSHFLHSCEWRGRQRGCSCRHLCRAKLLRSPISQCFLTIANRREIIVIQETVKFSPSPDRHSWIIEVREEQRTERVVKWCEGVRGEGVNKNGTERREDGSRCISLEIPSNTEEEERREEAERRRERERMSWLTYQSDSYCIMILT